mmetsp:Transcript_24830/g.58931  ORF Transcript_24830/g.58931 Transcript_24830/m.58931 type:complete len:206 (+) Transcript_24830:160-777(+)
MSLLLRSINRVRCAVVFVAVVLMVMAATTTTTDAFQPSTRSSSSSSFSIHRALSPASPSPSASHLILSAMTEEKTKESKVEETTEKYGLEVGLAQAAKDGDGESAKSLLKKYGIAYLATSIPLALVSFGICYVLVDNGVDVGALLSKVGIDNSSAADKAGTFAIAYAAHKAASPIRFPPTVLLTPLVAKLIGKEPETVVDDGESP